MIRTLGRRPLFGSLAAAATASALPASYALARPPGGLASVPAIAQMKIGRVTVSFLSDGVFDAPSAWFTGAPEAEIEQRLRARLGNDGKSLRVNITTWLIDDGERLVLVDAGVPKGAMPGTGRLPAALKALGVAPEQIDVIALSHLHFDHVGGLLADGKPALPGPEVLVPRADAAFFTDPAALNAAPDFLKDNFALVGAVLGTVPRIQRIDLDRQITPFVSTFDLRGHTPGHTGFRISDGGQTLLLVVDTLFDPAFHPSNPDIRIVFETDAEAAKAMRTRLFARAVEERALVAATHMPFPGLGRIERDGASLRWIAADFPALG